jgi:hypothetical protein
MDGAIAATENTDPRALVRPSPPMRSEPKTWASLGRFEFLRDAAGHLWMARAEFERWVSARHEAMEDFGRTDVEPYCFYPDGRAAINWPSQSSLEVWADFVRSQEVDDLVHAWCDCRGRRVLFLAHQSDAWGEELDAMLAACGYRVPARRSG